MDQINGKITELEQALICERIDSPAGVRLPSGAVLAWTHVKRHKFGLMLLRNCVLQPILLQNASLRERDAAVGAFPRLIEAICYRMERDVDDVIAARISIEELFHEAA